MSPQATPSGVPGFDLYLRERLARWSQGILGFLLGIGELVLPWR
jgi:hypothetical protein